MKRSHISKLALACAISAIFSFGGVRTGVYAYENLEANYSLEIVAAGAAGENGFSAVYGNGVSFTFDALNVGERGENGVFVASSESGTSDSSARKLFAVGFEGGYNYRVSAAGGTLTVERSEYRAEKYAPFASFEGADGKFLGIYVMSEGIYSATVCIDDFVCLDDGGKVTVRDGFDKRSRDNVGTIGKITEKYGFINKSEIFYTVSFLTEDGEVIAKQEVALYNKATLPEAPKKAGYTFKGWTEGYDNVASDVKCFAVYEEGETPVNPDNPDDPNQPEKEKTGCKSSVSSEGCIAAISAAALLLKVFLKRRRSKDA